MNKKRSVLIIYTGGTIGMVQEADTGLFRPFDFSHLYKQVPEIRNFDLDISAIAFEIPIDSSNMSPEIWVQLAKLIEKNYKKYDGFVILHGSDTMAYTASALSFMLENLNKPIILTGSQLPIGMIRTDGKENLITAIEIAAAYEKEIPLVPEVAVYFEYQLYRGNRTHKYNAEHFEAFESPNYPVLAEAGIRIEYNRSFIHPSSNKKLKVHTTFDTNIAVLTLYPGMSKHNIDALFNTKNLKAVIIQSYGSGNAPDDKALSLALKKANDKNIIVFNVTQCNRGSVDPARYATNKAMVETAVSGKDITLEASVTKLMFLLGQKKSAKETRELLEVPLRGEMSD